MTKEAPNSVLDKQDGDEIPFLDIAIDPEYDVTSMSAKIIKICENLSVENDNFEKIQTTILIEEYILLHKRFLYNIISQHIFNRDNPGTIHSNIESLLSYVNNKDYEKDFKSRNPTSKNTENILCIKKSVLKLLDHANLAEYQFEKLKQSDIEFKQNFNLQIMPVKNDIDNQLSSFSRDMTSQLISLIGLFTAMSFLVFGGINSLDNIFKSADNIPILKLMIVGCIWGICILNLVFVFMFFISKMTKLNIKSSDGNLIQKYPLVWWSNLIICTILLLSTWLFYIDHYDIGYWFLDISKSNSFVSVIGFVFILLFFSINSMIILKKYHEKESNLIETITDVTDNFQDSQKQFNINNPILSTQSLNTGQASADSYAHNSVKRSTKSKKRRKRK